MSYKKDKTYTPKEKDLLLSLIKDYKCIIENKKRTKTMNREKQHAWAEITNKFNSNKSVVKSRTIVQLRRLWTNVKYLLKGRLRTLHAQAPSIPVGKPKVEPGEEITAERVVEELLKNGLPIPVQDPRRRLLELFSETPPQILTQEVQSPPTNNPIIKAEDESWPDVETHAQNAHNEKVVALKKNVALAKYRLQRERELLEIKKEMWDLELRKAELKHKIAQLACKNPVVKY